MEYKNSSNLHMLSDADMEQVRGGSMDWSLFSDEFMKAWSSGMLQTTAANKELIEAIKEKNWIDVAAKAIPLIASDPTIALIAYRCSSH